MPKSLTFQDLIQKLNTYWGQKGCLIMQPYDLEVGAGTFSPHTFLRALGPEPWKAAYVEPSRRPTDGRYGENPHRTQHYYQYQVLLKPAPENSQDLYLDSLKALGKALRVMYPEERVLELEERLHIGEGCVKTIFIHAFMDEHTFEVDRIKKCCTHYALPDGRLMPGCAYNMFYRHKDPRFAGESGATPIWGKSGTGAGASKL